MKKILIAIGFIIGTLTVYGRDYARGRGIEDLKGPSIGGILLMISVAIIYIIYKANQGLKNREIVYNRLGINENSIYRFGRYAIQGKLKLEYPIAYIESGELIIISKEEADEHASASNKIRIKLSHIKSITVTNTKDGYTSYTQGFNKALAIIEENSFYTEFVFNGKYESEIRRYNELKNELTKLTK